MSSDGPQVEFEREVTRSLVEDGEPVDGERLMAPALRFWRSVRMIRWTAMIAGAAVIAGLTHRSGLSLDGALCVFIGLLPVLWIMSWFAGLTFGARRAAGLVRSVVEADGALPRPERHSQRVALNVAADALEVTLSEADQTRSHRWPWAEVQLIRQESAAFWLRREVDAIEVPRTAFADAQAFESFALAAQARIWAAMR